MNCNCRSKDQMVQKIIDVYNNDVARQYNWIPLLFDDNTPSPCCLLVFLIYCAICKDNDDPLATEARTILSPLICFDRKK